MSSPDSTFVLVQRPRNGGDEQLYEASSLEQMLDYLEELSGRRLTEQAVRNAIADGGRPARRQEVTDGTD